MKIHEAALVVLQHAGKPMHARDIHREIIVKELYAFGAKDPVSIVSQSLRKKSAGAPNVSDVVFKRTAPGTYGLAEWSD